MYPIGYWRCSFLAFSPCPTMAHHDGHDHSGHGQGDHGHNDAHDHSDDTEPALQSLIYKQIEFDKIRTYNESEPDAGANVVKKTWQERLNPEPELTSDADEQLLMIVPYVPSFPNACTTGLDGIDRYTASLVY